jgi:hypothetical protein
MASATSNPEISPELLQIIQDMISAQTQSKETLKVLPKIESIKDLNLPKGVSSLNSSSTLQNKLPTLCLQCGKGLTLLQQLSTSFCLKHSTEHASWEMYIKTLLRNAGIPGPSCANDQMINNKRPDFGWELLDRIVLLEIDEDSHSRRSSIQELEKIVSNAPDVSSGKPLFFIRFNPSQRSQEDFYTCFSTLLMILRAALFDEEYIKSWHAPPKINVLYMFYSGQRAREHIEIARLDTTRIHIVDVLGI